MAGPRPRILFLGPDEPGGMATAMALLTAPLSRRYEVDFLATHRGDGAARRLRVFAAALLALAWWSLRGRGRIVHVHSTVRGSMYRKAVCVFLARALRRRVVLHLHSGPGDVATFRAGLDGPRLRFLRGAFAAADAVLAVSSASAAALAEGFGRTDIVVLPNPAPAPPAGLERRAAEPGPALYLGGFANPVKGGTILLAALELPAASPLPLVMAGPGELPAGGRELLERRADLQWRGWLEPDEKDELMRRAQVFVLPSTSEGLPMALLEAMTYELAIVASTVGGVPDVADDGVEALLVPPGDPEALAAALARLAAEPELRSRLGAAAATRARELDGEHIAARLEEIYDSVLASRA